MESIFERVKTFFLAEGLNKTYWIAYSGGLDSHVLLHISAEIRKLYPLSIHAIHVNHHLSPHATSWAKHCAHICQNLKIPLLQKEVHANAINGKSPEETARLARYAVFAEVISTHDCLVTAHQQDDQAETVLLQLLRGAGPKGLSAMPLVKSFAKGCHARPLLNYSRDDLKNYAQDQQLTWIEDESNLNVSYTRNFLRHEVLPILKKRWPSVTKTLSRVAAHCAETQSLLDSLARDDLKSLAELNSEIIINNPDMSLSFPHHVPMEAGHDSLRKTNFSAESHFIISKSQRQDGINSAPIKEKIIPLNITKLLELPSERQPHVLREWIQRSGMPLPSLVKMQQIQKCVLQANQDKSPHIIWGEVELRRFQNKLYLMNCLPEHDSTQIYSWDMQKPLIVNNHIVLHAILSEGKGLRSDLSSIQVRFRQGGEYCRLPGRKKHHDLKKLFQQWKVPPWYRERIPLLFYEDKLIAVVGYFLDEDFMVDRGMNGYLILSSAP